MPRVKLSDMDQAVLVEGFRRFDAVAKTVRKRLWAISKSVENGGDELVAGVKLLSIASIAEVTLSLIVPLEEQHLLRPLRVITHAVRDTLRGSKPKILFERRGRSGQPTNTSTDVLRGMVAADLEALVRLGAKPETASQLMARELQAQGIRMPNGKPISAKQIRTWRYSMGGTAGPIATKFYRSALASASFPQEKKSQGFRVDSAGIKRNAAVMATGLRSLGF